MKTRSLSALFSRIFPPAYRTTTGMAQSSFISANVHSTEEETMTSASAPAPQLARRMDGKAEEEALADEERRGDGNDTAGRG